MIICTARRSCNCDHKRNGDGQFIYCAISANKEQCAFAEPAEDTLAKLRTKMGVAKEAIK